MNKKQCLKFKYWLGSIEWRNIDKFDEKSKKSFCFGKCTLYISSQCYPLWGYFGIFLSMKHTFIIYRGETNNGIHYINIRTIVFATYYIWWKSILVVEGGGEGKDLFNHIYISTSIILFILHSLSIWKEIHIPIQERYLNLSRSKPEEISVR